MADARVTVVNNRAVVQVAGADLLAPIIGIASAAAEQTAADRAATALSAATAESAAGPTYASASAGLAATSDGDAFAVDNGDGTVTVYLNDGGSAVSQRTLATSAALASAESGKGIDLVGRPTVAQLLASTTAARGAGSKWYAQADGVLFTYIEAASGASDQHVTTAGGVKLYVQPTERGYDARAFGAKDDWDGSTGTNNFAPLEKLYSLKPLTIRLPQSPSGTGIYMVDGTTTVTDATGVVIDNDPGVSLYVDGGIPPTFIKGQRSTRDFRVNYNVLRYQRNLGPAMRQNVKELGRPGSALDGRIQVPQRLDFDDATHWQLSSWPNGSFVAATPSSVTADLVQWGTAPASAFVASMFHVVPGDFVQAKVADLTTYLPAIAIFTDDGWVVVRQSQTASQSTIIFTQKVGAAASVETSTVNAVAAQTTYRFGKAALGIAIFDQRSFGLVLNGTVIRRYRTTSNIQRAGWAGGFGTAGNFAVANPVLIKNKKTFGIKPLKIVTLGDSTGDETVTQQSQFDFMRQFIGGIGGCQIDTLLNLAHSGDTSAAQVTALESAGLTSTSGYDYCAIQIGINDIQTNVAVATFVANVLSMITYCRNIGIEPIVGLPAMYYSKADAQAIAAPYTQDGGDTSRSDLGATYRLALMQMLADNHVYCNLASFEDMGAVVASLLTMKGSPWGDQMVVDNVHPTTWGAMLLGWGWAKAISAHMTGAQEHEFSGVAATQLSPTYFTASTGSTATPRYTIDDRTIHLSYYLSVPGNLNDGLLVGTLPKRLRPRSDVLGLLTNVNSALAPIAAVSTTSPPFWKIGSDGSIKVYGVAGTPSFLGISANWKI